MEGRVERLMVLVPNRLVANGSAGEMLDLFVDYDQTRWVVHSFGDFTLFVQ